MDEIRVPLAKERKLRFNVLRIAAATPFPSTVLLYTESAA